jgi:hypothetical protein
MQCNLQIEMASPASHIPLQQASSYPFFFLHRSCYNKQVSKLLHIIYPPLPASEDTGQGYAEICVAQTSRMHFNKIDAGLLLGSSYTMYPLMRSQVEERSTDAYFLSCINTSIAITESSVIKTSI